MIKQPIEGQTEAVIDAQGRHRGTKTWMVCSVCGYSRWIRSDSLRKKGFTGMCSKCHNKFTSTSGKTHPRWKGGKTLTWHGYVVVRLEPNDPFYAMSKEDGYILEHRIVMARHIGRCLESWEIVHHINGIKDDNRIENLELLPNRTAHLSSMAEAAEIRRLKNEIKRLKSIIHNYEKQQPSKGRISQTEQTSFINIENQV